MKKYPKAEYIKLLKCPECGYYEQEENDGMPNRDDFAYRTDDEGVEYIECPCGAEFVEE